MAINFTSGQFSAVTRNGAPLVGGLVYTYARGTTNLQDSYTSRTLAVANTNPVVLDEFGRSAIWLDPALQYSVSVRNAAGVVQYETELDSEVATLAGPGGAAMVGTTPSGGLAATNVQAALNELDTEKTSAAALAASSGSSLIGHIASGTGAVARTAQSKMRDIVSAADYSGYDQTGASDCKAAILAAAVAIGMGGVVYVPGKALIDTALTVPAGVTLKGPYAQVASFGSNQDASTYNSMSALIVNPSVSIKLSSGAGIDGCFIYRKGMTFPAPNTSAFAGTAIIGDGTNFLDGDDLNIKNSLIIGFAQAIYTNQCQRVKCTDIYFDCTSGIRIRNSVDVSYVTRCHGWPFSTIKTYALAGGVNGGNAAEVLLQRSGTAFLFDNVGDWTKVTDCFSYGYFRGVNVDSCNSMTLISVSSDNTPEDPTGFALPLLGHPGAIGFVITGTSFDTRLIACQSAAQGNAAYYINTSSGSPTRMYGCDAWSPIERCVLVDSGDLAVIGGTQRNAPDGVVVNNANSWVWIDEVRFNALSGFAVKTLVSTSRVRIGRNNDFGNAAAGSVAVTGTLTTPSVASAATLNLPANGNEFGITGTTDFGTLVGGYKDRWVRLFFSDVLTVFSGTGSTNNMRLSGGADFATTNGATLTLAHNGVQWYEVGRSA